MLTIHSHNAEKVAHWWADAVSSFLNSPRKRLERQEDPDGNRVRRTRLQHYADFFQDLCRAKNISEPTIASNWEQISKFLSNKPNLIGYRLMDENWRREVCGPLMDNDLKKAIVDTFKKIYGEVINEFGYDVVLKLKIRTCPYCNRNYTFTVKRKKRRNVENSRFCTRPEFDHFFNKSENPFFAVTFFNLVPSCKECNHGKGTKKAEINPYFGMINSAFTLIRNKHQRDMNPREDDRLNANEIYGLKKGGSFDIDFYQPNDAEQKNIETFGLRERYNQHKDYVMEIVEKSAAYNELTRQGIVDRFQGVFHNEGEVYNLIFGRYLSDAEQPMRPLSKLTADVLEQLGLRL